jgi:hypothetical protein
LGIEKRWEELIFVNLYFLLSFIMGNEQSAPAPRRPPNKLSKPRTNNNSTANLLDTKKPPIASRRNAVSTNASPTKERWSRSPGDVLAGEAVQVEETKQRKRMSLFRSKSTQPQSKSTIGLGLDTGIASQFVEPSPVEQPVQRWSRLPRESGNSEGFDMHAEEAYREQPVQMLVMPSPPTAVSSNKA